MDWNEYFMKMTFLVAERSKDKNTHIGAVIVGQDNEIRSTGYNGFPRGIIDDKPERQERPEKYFWFAHAERNAIYNAARMGISVKDCKMYTNGTPCMNCAIAIVQAGIIEVIVDKWWDDNNSGKWLEEANRTKELFKEADVELNFYDGCVNNDRIHRYRNGEVWNLYGLKDNL